MDPYHPHYPSADNDHFQKIMDNAERAANPYRLMCMRYTQEQEKYLADRWSRVLAERSHSKRLTGTP